MAHSKRLFPEHLEHVRRQLGEVVGYSRHHLFEEPVKIAEAYEICLLSLKSLGKATLERSVSRYIVRTDAWFHQILLNGKPLAIAQSAAVGFARNRWSVQSFLYSPLAPKLARATARIDRDRVEEDIEAILVVVPAFELVFFLLYNGSDEEVLTVSCPPTTGELIEDQFFEAEQFLELLSKAVASGDFVRCLPVSRKILHD